MCIIYTQYFTSYTSPVYDFILFFLLFTATCAFSRYYFVGRELWLLFFIVQAQIRWYRMVPIVDSTILKKKVCWSGRWFEHKPKIIIFFLIFLLLLIFFMGRSPLSINKSLCVRNEFWWAHIDVSWPEIGIFEKINENQTLNFSRMQL